MTIGILGIAAMMVLALMRVPIAISMGVVGFFGLMHLRGPNAAAASVVNTVFDTGFQYTLSVIPLFVLMGNFVTRSGLSEELYRLAYALIGHRRGGLAMATIGACAGFSAICGSAVATAATMTRVAYPEMKKYGYSDALASGAIASGGTLGILIPPSTLMIIYCIITEQNIGMMFAAGVIPGIVATALYMAAVRWTVWRHPEAGPRGTRASWVERLRAFRDVWGVLALFGVVMGGLYGGFFTSTEAASIGAAGGLFFAVVRGGLRLIAVKDVLVESARTTAMLFAIIIGAAIFGNFLNFSELPARLQSLVAGFEAWPILVILAMCSLYVVLGTVLEELSLILLTVPLFFPIVISLGYDPIWFGILVVCVVEIGMISPPVGMNLFVMNAMMPNVPVTTVWRGVIPFMVSDIIRLAVLIAFPALTLFLPGLLFGS